MRGFQLLLALVLALSCVVVHAEDNPFLTVDEVSTSVPDQFYVSFETTPAIPDTSVALVQQLPVLVTSDDMETVEVAHQPVPDPGPKHHTPDHVQTPEQTPVQVAPKDHHIQTGPVYYTSGGNYGAGSCGDGSYGSYRWRGSNGRGYGVFGRRARPILPWRR